MRGGENQCAHYAEHQYYGADIVLLKSVEHRHPVITSHRGNSIRLLVAHVHLVIQTICPPVEDMH